VTFNTDSSQKAKEKGVVKGRYTGDHPPAHDKVLPHEVPSKNNARIGECECIAFASQNGAYTVIDCPHHIGSA
jgi:hypothetical protein